MRTKNSFMNFLANSGSYTINLILSFISRTIFIRVLSEEYLGVSGLFTNILSVLSLAELGIGTAMIYHLYKPIAEDDTQGITQLMNLYRRLYAVVGGFIAVAGLALVPFLDVFIKDKPDLPYLTVYYLLYLSNTVLSYFWGYKRAIIDGHQKSYITTMYNTIFTTTQFVLQIISLLVFRNFMIFLSISIACGIICNIVVAHKADKMYPYLKEDKKSLPSKEIQHSVFKNVGAMSLHRLGDVVLNNTDNLVMSSFVGLGVVGLMSNYQMIQGSIAAALGGIFGAFTASIGNLSVTDDEESVFRVYRTLEFLCFWLYGFSSVAFIILYNPFIEAWAGEKYLLDMTIVLVFVANFYMSGMRKVILTFRDAMGLYWYDRYKPIFEVVINLVVSIVLVIKMGTVGVLLGTLVSTMTTCFWIEPLVTYKHGFHRSVSHYFKVFTLYTITTVAVGGFTYWVCSHITMGGFLEVFIKAAICLVMFNGIVLALYHRTEEFGILWRELMKIVRNYIDRKKQPAA